jgi:N-dimethylarginine dimethylaminohydrolase
MYTKAIVRRPGRNFSEGITTSTLGKPDFRKALEQHSAYCDALAGCGLELLVLEADERYPDGCFVEDTAIVTGDIAVITTGAGSRLGEEAEISNTLSEFRKIETIKFPGTLDGGDVLRVENHFSSGSPEERTGKVPGSFQEYFQSTVILRQKKKWVRGSTLNQGLLTSGKAISFRQQDFQK